MRRIIALLVMICFVAGTFAKVPVTGNKIRLTDNWEFLRQDVGNIWELVRPIKKGQPEEQPIWTKVTLPHCFNAVPGFSFVPLRIIPNSSEKKIRINILFR